MKSAGATRARGRAGGVSRAFDLRGTLVPGDPREISGAEVTASFDGLNRDIIVMLQEDGRRSFATIARKLGVSEGTVRARVRQMRHDKLLRFVAVVNPVALGYSAWAMLGIKLAPGVSPERIAKYFRDRSETVYVMRVASRYDLLVEVVCEDPDELRRFLDQHCYSSPEIASVEPMIGLGAYKSLVKWEETDSDGESSGNGENGGNGDGR
jgi:Lrp/AsnC family transcriptional regulator for asnA, asnC and gidA